MPALVLGTAQFGSAYGVTNTRGRLADEKIAEILLSAAAGGITSLDSARAYGDAHRRIARMAQGFAIATKIDGVNPDSIEGQLSDALVDLGRPRIEACLIHDWHTLDQATRRAAAEALENERGQRVHDVGISAYEEADLITARDAFGQLDVVQVPANALDRRLDDAPVVRELKAQGTRFQVRSVFLQGLLVARSQTVVGQHPAVVAFHQACEQAGVSPLSVALGHARALPWADEIVVGVTSVSELQDILKAWETGRAVLAPVARSTTDLSLLDPRRWGRL